jgi:hypothetical protein
LFSATGRLLAGPLVQFGDLRCQGVLEWSEYSPSVFLELGARLAISEWGAVQVIDEQHLPNGAKAPKLRQIEKLRRLF